MIKSDTYADEKFGKLTTPAKHTFIASWTFSDDYGVVRGNPAWLKSQIFPYETDLELSRFKEWLSEIEQAGMIVPFTHNGESFYFIKHFTDHQKVDHPSKSRNPEPPVQDLILKNRARELLSIAVFDISRNNGIPVDFSGNILRAKVVLGTENLTILMIGG